jgi:hypothetical protein
VLPRKYSASQNRRPARTVSVEKNIRNHIFFKKREKGMQSKKGEFKIDSAKNTKTKSWEKI